MPGYSIIRHFAGSTVLLTGATGYVGALVLEKLLRSTDVGRVYVLMRGKRGDGIEERLERLLDSSVFHLLRGNEVLRKVVPVFGSLTAPELGLSCEDRRTLIREVDTVIHCAADIRLEAGIRELLSANYEGTRKLLRLCHSFDHLRAFIHVSSAYTNMNAPAGSLVKEAIYPLTYGDQLVDDYELVHELLALPAHNANSRAEGLMKAWNFPNNYTLSKHLAEYMVADHHKHCGLPIAIVRPTLISSVARDPYPGYTGNFAGHVGATLAFMAGLFDSPEASNYRGSNVWDVIPADVVVADILAAAAAVGAGVAGSCVATRTINGRLLPATAAAAADKATVVDAAAANRGRRSGGGAAAGPLLATEDTRGGAGRDQNQPEDSALSSSTVPPLLIVHCGSSTLYPLTIMESWNFGIEAYGAWPTGMRLCKGCAPPLTVDHEPNPARAARLVAWTGWKVWAAASLMRLLGEEKVARKLSVGFDSFRVINQPKTDVNLRFSTANMQRLAAGLDPAERTDFLLLWKPTAPGTAGAAAVCGLATAARFGLAAAAASKVAAAAAAVVPAGGGKAVGVVSPPASAPGSVIRAKLCTGGGRSSQTSSSGSGRTWGTSEDCSEAPSPSSSDTDALRGSSSSDAEDSTVGSGCVSPRASAGPGDIACHDVSSTRPSSGRRQPGAVLSSEAAAALARMQAIPIVWRDYHINLGAFLYCTVFRMPTPPQHLPITKEQVLNWLHITPEDAYVDHHFELFK